jgi:hypothetical protein
MSGRPSFISRHRVVLSVATAVIVLAGVGGGLALALLRPTQLTVLIQDVPRRTRASVLITGPGGFSKHLATSEVSLRLSGGMGLVTDAVSRRGWT